MLLKQISEDDMIKMGRLFKSGLGEEVLGILNKLFYNTISFDPENTHVTAYREGQRDIVQIFRTTVGVVKRKEMNDER